MRTPINTSPKKNFPSYYYVIGSKMGRKSSTQTATTSKLTHQDARPSSGIIEPFLSAEDNDISLSSEMMIQQPLWLVLIAGPTNIGERKYLNAWHVVS